MSNLTTRILVAIVAIPIILLLTMTGGSYFFGFIAVVSALALYEYYKLLKRKGAEPQVILGIAMGLCVNAVFIFAKLQYAVVGLLADAGISVPSPTMSQAFLIILLIFVPLMMLVELFRNKPSASVNVAATLFGVGYVSLFFGALIGLRELFIPADFPMYLHFDVHGIAIPEVIVSEVYEWGGYTIIALFASIWMCDSAAYFAGTWFGKHKIFERVSPKKTWEGAIAGFVFAVLTFVIAKETVLPYMSLTNAIVCGAIVGIFGQLGDMVESLLKRDAGVKDSSTLIPGHGGVLDRFDSLLFVSPLLFVYLDFIVF